MRRLEEGDLRRGPEDGVRRLARWLGLDASGTVGAVVGAILKLEKKLSRMSNELCRAWRPS